VVRTSSKESILDAAEAVVADAGANRLTLEAVARKAGVSKGGLIYHFPSKNDLLRGMIDRHVAGYEVMREEVLSRMAPGPGRHIRAEIETCRRISERKPRRVSSALLAVAASQPELLEPVRRMMRERIQRLAQPPAEYESAVVLMLAMDGLRMLDLLQVLPFDDAQRGHWMDVLARRAEGSEEEAGCSGESG
jgi:AcrR family transcriptional regulator